MGTMKVCEYLGQEALVQHLVHAVSITGVDDKHVPEEVYQLI